MVLRKDEKSKCYSGRVWRSEEQWMFQEEGTGIEVTVAAKPDTGISVRRRCPQCEARLFKAMQTEYVKRKQANAKAARREASKADAPKTISDMAVKGKTPEGKLVYAWGDPDSGRVEVQVTPRDPHEAEG